MANSTEMHIYLFPLATSLPAAVAIINNNYVDVFETQVKKLTIM
jgi:hypothetical protein